MYCLAFYVGALAFKLDVGDLHLLDVLIADVEKELVNAAKFVWVYCVVLNSLKIGAEDELLKCWTLCDRKIYILIVNV